MKRLLRAFLYSCCIAFLSLVVVAFFWDRPLLATGLMIIVSILMLLVRRSKEDLLLYFFCALAGALSEAFGIAFGAWTYAFPNLIGIPYWLPFLWGIAGLFVKRIEEEIHDYITN